MQGCTDGQWEVRIQTQFCLLLNHKYLLALLASLKAERNEGLEQPWTMQADGQLCILLALCSPGLLPRGLDYANQCQLTHS